MSTINHDRHAQRFTTEIDGHRAELDYELRGTTMVIVHTGVPSQIGGRGVAAQLMQAALAEAARQGWDIDPQCSYAAAYMARHGLAGQEHADKLRDEAVEESFPASDPPATGGST